MTATTSTKMRSVVMATIAAIGVSCGGIGGSLPDCVGGYTGNYTGGSEGLVSAFLGFDTVLRLTFVFDGTERTVDATVSGTDLSGSGGGATVSGTFNVDNCTASGTWERSGVTGDWNVEKMM